MKTRNIVALIVGAMGLIGAIIAAIIIVCGTKPSVHNNDAGENLNFRGWYLWGDGLQVSANKNTVTFNGKVSLAGYVNEHLDTVLKNKTVLLEIKNAATSEFSEYRMIKITVNKNDQLVRPIGITDLVLGEYIPAEYNKVEFVLPHDFDGKLGFVFYQADLKGLQITATYK
jgi:hypothetical protein